MVLTHRIVACAAGLGLLCLAGCATNNPDPATAAAAQKAGRGTATTNAPFVEQGVARATVYPHFTPPQPATTQMTEAEKQQFQARMAASVSANDAQAATDAVDYNARMKAMQTIADQHSQATLKSIAGNGKKTPRKQIQD
ncbi:MAG: hypothetical protein ACTHJ3_02290 [Pararhizobium sp.]